MKIFVTGATGFVGQELVSQLLEAQHSVRALVRTEGSGKKNDKIEIHRGDSTRPDSLKSGLEGCDAVINLVGIIREFPSRAITFERLHRESTGNLLQAAAEQGVTRFLQMSANGVRADAVTEYHKTKWAAEELVRQSALDWTIFRPSLIFGANDQFVNMLASLIKTLPVVPVMGDGRYRLQPVCVTDVARGFVRALDNKEAIGQTYHCGGPDSYSYDEILDLIGQALGRKTPVRKLHQPLWLMQPLVAKLQALPQFPMTADQLQMLLEGNCCDPSAWRKSFNLDLTAFPQGIASYLK